MLQLSKRLKAVADFVTEGNRVVDVGTDHGYVPIYLVEQGKIPSAIAMDVNKGPLERAKEHIAAFGYEAYIETRLSDGLSALQTDEGDTLIIAGMGGGLTIRILSEGEKKLERFSELILEPQSDIHKVRRFLRENAMRIVQETMVYEEGKYYPVLRVKFGGEAVSTKDEYLLEDWYGPCLLAESHPVLQQFLQKEEQQIEKVLCQLEQSKNSKAGQERKTQLNEQLQRNRLAQEMR